MPRCPNCDVPLPRRGRSVCRECGSVFHWRKDRDTLVPMRGRDQEAVLLATFGSALLLAARWQGMVAHAAPR